MDRSEILKNVQDIFCDVLDEEDVKLSDETTADDVDGWDSLTHIQLIVAVEKFFKIKFNSKEILTWGNVGEMIDGISNKL